MTALAGAVAADGTTDACPRCGGRFHCGATDATPCPCATLKLDAALQQRLRERYQGCLCLRCLQQLAAGAPLG